MGRRSVRCSRSAVATVVALTCFSGPAVAAPGDTCADATENASVSEYCESVPSVGGAQGVRDTPGGGTEVPAATAEQLRRTPLGAALVGEAAAEPADAAPVAPRHKPAKQRSTRARPEPVREPAPISPASSRDVSASAVLDGLPLTVPLLIALILIAGLVAARLKRTPDA